MDEYKRIVMTKARVLVAISGLFISVGCGLTKQTASSCVVASQGQGATSQETAYQSTVYAFVRTPGNLCSNCHTPNGAASIYPFAQADVVKAYAAASVPGNSQPSFLDPAKGIAGVSLFEQYASDGHSGGGNVGSGMRASVAAFNKAISGNTASVTCAK